MRIPTFRHKFFPFGSPESGIDTQAAVAFGRPAFLFYRQLSILDDHHLVSRGFDRAHAHHFDFAV